MKAMHITLATCLFIVFLPSFYLVSWLLLGSQGILEQFKQKQNITKVPWRKFNEIDVHALWKGTWLLLLFLLASRMAQQIPQSLACWSSQALFLLSI